MLVSLAKKAHLTLKRTFVRKGDKTLNSAIRLASEKSYKKCSKKDLELKGQLFSVMTETKKLIGDEKKDEAKILAKIRKELEIAERIYNQKKSDSNKIYSCHAPETKCYKKNDKYYYGNKIGYTTTKRGDFILSIVSFNDTRNDTKTLKSCIEDTETMTGASCHTVLVDSGYKGKENHPENKKVLVS